MTARKRLQHVDDVPKLRIVFTKGFPVSALVGDERWTVDFGYGLKHARAGVFAKSDKGRTGVFIEGRTRYVEAEIMRGIDVPRNSIRHRIAYALHLHGRARLVEDDPKKDGFLEKLC